MTELLMFKEIDNYYSSAIGIEIRKHEELYENEKELLKSAELDNICNVEAWTAIGTNQQLAYSTHGIFRYFGKFPPPIATYLINKYTKKGDFVCDPMCGSGTTAVESLILDRKCMINDINPLSILLAEVKTTFIPEEILRNKLNNIIENYRPLSLEEYNFVPTAIKDPDHWFLPDTSNSLRGIKYLIEKEENKQLKNFLNIIFAATVRRVSKATTQQGRLFLDVETALPDALDMFVKRFEIGIKGVSSLNSKKDIIYKKEDLKDILSSDFENKAKLVILHPPYFNSYKYSSVNSLETGWLGIDRNKFHKKEVKEFFKVGKPENYTKYIDDMFVALNNSLALVEPGCILALMIGDTIMKGQHVKVTKQLLDKLDKEKYTIEKIALRVPKYTEATWVTSQRRDSNNVGITLYDYIVIIRKVN